MTTWVSNGHARDSLIHAESHRLDGLVVAHCGRRVRPTQTWTDDKRALTNRARICHICQRRVTIFRANRERAQQREAALAQRLTSGTVPVSELRALLADVEAGHKAAIRQQNAERALAYQDFRIVLAALIARHAPEAEES